MQAWRLSGWRRGPGLSTLLLLGFVAAALLGGVALTGQTVMAERHQREQAARTSAVLIALRDISRTAVNGETGQRGYLITLDRRYLAPYLVARQQYRANVIRLRGVMGPALTPRQRALLDRIERLNAAKFAELDDSVRLIRAGALREARPTVERIAERIHALLTAHEVTQGTSARRSARLADLVETALRPCRGDGQRVRIGGPEVILPDRAIVPLGLVLHELTTNAVKYGAWARPGGLPAVDWTLATGELRLAWSEHPVAPVADAPGGRGFGSTLIDSAARQLEGTIERSFPRTGIVVTIRCPLGAEGTADTG